MRHFSYLEATDTEALFQRTPRWFTADSSREVLESALGATLYMPGTRTTLCADIVKNKAAGTLSMVACLEDAIADTDVPRAEVNVVEQFQAFARTGLEAPMLFIRVRTADQIGRLVCHLDESVQVLTGFVVPKFTPDSGEFLDAVREASARAGRHLDAMPVLESPEIMHAETRRSVLAEAFRLIEGYRAHVLAIRVGATDLCGLYGLRRDRNLTIWDIAVVREALADIVNIFARGGRYTVTGAVWEYFSSGERIFKPTVRESPFRRSDLPDGPKVRSRLVGKDLDGLLREVVLDKATGMTGKTVIHPSHVRLVHAISVVTSEEFADACDIIAIEDSGVGGGVQRSSSGSKMLEGRPHLLWAKQTLRRADAFGVLAEDRTFVDLLDDEWHHA